MARDVENREERWKQGLHVLLYEFEGEAPPETGRFGPAFNHVPGPIPAVGTLIAWPDRESIWVVDEVVFDYRDGMYYPPFVIVKCKLNEEE